jgi:hypothetical protein
MTPQEKELITTLLTRLKSAGSQPKDPEAEALIRQAMAEQPDAPYFLVQTVLIQDFSLHNAQNRIAELEKEVAEGRTPKPATSFLGGLFGRAEPAASPSSGSVPPSGPWARGPAQPAAAGQPSAPPGAGYASPGYSPSASGPGLGGPFGGGMGGGGFLRAAAATAAGVAGGALLFEGIRSLFGPSTGALGAGFGGIGGATPGLSETVINNYYGNEPGAAGGGDFAGSGLDPGTGQDYASEDADQGFDPGTGSGPDYDAGSDYDTGADDGGGGDYDSGSDFDPGGDGSDDFSC